MTFFVETWMRSLYLDVAGGSLEVLPRAVAEGECPAMVLEINMFRAEVGQREGNAPTFVVILVPAAGYRISWWVT
jgi:hypothetical protein